MFHRTFVRTIVGTAALLACAGTALGQQLGEMPWTAPGWYQIAVIVDKYLLWAGPFAGEGDCNAQLPPEDDLSSYFCEYLDANPY